MTAIIALSLLALQGAHSAPESPSKQRKKIISQTIGECGLVVSQERGELGFLLNDQDYWPSLKPSSLRVINEGTNQHQLRIGWISYGNFDPRRQNVFIATDIDNKARSVLAWQNLEPFTPVFNHNHVNIYAYITEYPPYIEGGITLSASWSVKCLD